MITAVLGDRTLELAAETPYRQAAKEAFRHFGTSEGTVKIYAGGQHVKSFRGGGQFHWGEKTDTRPVTTGFVKLWTGQVKSRTITARTAQDHKYTMYMKLPESTHILIIRERNSEKFNHKTVPYQEVVFDNPHLHIGADRFDLTDPSSAKPFPALHDILNKIFRHKNILTAKSIVSLRTDEMAALNSRLKDNDILPKICAPFLGQRYIWDPESGILTTHESRPKGAPPAAPLIITCPFVTIVSAKMVEAHKNAQVTKTVTKEGAANRDRMQEVQVTNNTGTIHTVKAPIPEGLQEGGKFTFENRTEIGFPWFSNMLGSRFQAAIKGRLRELPIERTDISRSETGKMKDKITLQYDHGNISLGWRENKLFLRHNDLEVDSTPQQAKEFEQTGKIPWVDQAFTRNWQVLLSERIDMAKELNRRHQLYTYNKECTQNVMYTGTLKPDGPYRESSEVKICGAKEENNAGAIWDAATKKKPEAEPTYTMLLQRYEQAKEMNSHSIAIAFGMK